MTKPVQIERFNIVSDKKGWTHHENSEAGPYCLFADAQSHEQAALLQVRSLLEAKAKEWLEFKRDRHITGPAGATITNFSNELLSLAATLGNQGK